MTIDEVERCVAHVLALARSRGLDKLDPGGRDYYWTVPSPEWLDVTKAPQMAVGSLDDDMAQLVKLVAEPERASSVDLDRAAAVFRLISDQLSGCG